MDKEADYQEGLRKQFQKDIDDTVAELMQSMDCHWEGEVEEGDLVSRRLDFDFEIASSEQGDEREWQWPTDHFEVTPITKCKVCVCACVCACVCVCVCACVCRASMCVYACVCKLHNQYACLTRCYISPGNASGVKLHTAVLWVIMSTSKLALVTGHSLASQILTNPAEQLAYLVISIASQK